MTTATLEDISTSDILSILDEQLAINQKEEVGIKYNIGKNVLNHALKEENLKSTDITDLVEKLKERKEEELKEAGLLISIAVNFIDTSVEKLVNINAEGFAKPIDYLGFRNNGPLHITGNVGDFCGNENKGDIKIIGTAQDYLGCKMQTGYITLNGNAGSYTGYKMESGTINIYGRTGLFCGSGMTQGDINIYNNAGAYSGEYMAGGRLTIHGNSQDIGKYMKDGSIVVYGNAEGTTGEYMEGRQIIVHGNIRNIASTIKSGTIYQGDKKIIANGKRLGWLNRFWQK